LQRLAKATGLRRLVHLLELLEELAHSTELREIASPDLQEAGAGRDRMGPVCEYIERHLAEPLYLPDLARRTGLSESAFSRLFMKCTSRTLPQYVNELRIARACRLLAETDQTVNEIAAGCGYSSLANFQRQFQKVQHRPPLAYRGIVRRTR
jgi:AraC-like DNA-binding protein